MSKTESLGQLARAAAVVAWRRRRQGPRRPSWPWTLEVVVEALRRAHLECLDLRPEEVRARWEAATLPSPVTRRVTFSAVDAGGVPGRWCSPEGARPDRAWLYLHGGGYAFGSTRTHQELVARLAVASGVRVLTVDYRLAPEHPFPAAVEDAVAAYGWLAAHHDRVVIGGDSAGGGLSLATMLSLRDEGRPLPRAAVLICPWVALDVSDGSMASNEPFDWLSRRGFEAWSEGYLAGQSPRAPLASPLYADLAGLPPLLVQVGEAEMLLDQARALARRAAGSGVRVELSLAPDMVHDWHVLAALFPPAQRAIDEAGRFARHHLDRSPA